MTLSVLIPAAGFARRMRGADKLLELVDSEPILRRQARLALGLGGVVRVTLPAEGQGPDRLASLAGLPVDIVLVPDAATGMAASLRHGTGVCGAGLMILLPDMPGIGGGEIASMASGFAGAPDRVICGAAKGRAGHPVILPARLVAGLAGLKGDQGAKEIICGEVPVLVELPGDAALLDLDSPEDWVAWRGRTQV
jgi:molybdenum cofactor cytidylyltransferase